MSQRQRVDFLGCPIDTYSLKETLELIEQFIRERHPRQHVVINADKFLKLRRDKRLKEIISDCDIINPDGMPIVWAARLLGIPLKERITGTDLMEHLVALAGQKGYSVFFLGAKEESVRRVCSVYRERYPGLKIAGYRNGYWGPQEEDAVVQMIRRSHPDILFVGFSSPKKEYFMAAHLKEMKVPFSMGVGGSFDVVAGLKKRAPLWMQRSGLEWLYRFLQEPLRLWKRYILGNVRFILVVLGALIKK